MDPGPSPVDERDERRLQDESEWETQWSEAGPAGSRSAHPQTSGGPAAAAAPHSAPTAGGAAAELGDTGQSEPAGHGSPAPVRPVHHAEYTGPHAPTLPGAETAAVEETATAGMTDVAGSGAAPANHEVPAEAPTLGGLHEQAAAAETLDRTQSSALAEEGAGHHRESVPEHSEAAGEPTGHLAAEEPYGAGSASPAADGSGPADYSVKADAAAMVYYEEGHPEYEQTRADVWFESAAHAEAAGFRAPRRKRLPEA